MPALRAKSVQLTGYLESLLRAQLAESVTILTPRILKRAAANSHCGCDEHRPRLTRYSMR
jgi:kynureninase